MTAPTAGSFTDHPRKVLFRRVWAKPILKYLHDRLNKKLIYLGLPGIRALDILEWKEYLDKIIAFQAGTYDGRTTEEDAAAEMEELITILNDLETKSIITTYSLYVGYIEQVVMGEEDDYNEPLQIDDYITVYNLDFCNTLTKPFPIVDKDFNEKDCYKIDVIEKLLSIERKKFNAGSDASFVMFLTVHSNFIESMVSSINDPIIKTYISNNLKGVTKEKRGIRLLKAYTFYTLNEIFRKHGFNIEILPTIYYMGSGTYYDKQARVDRQFWLSTFTILGTPIELIDPPITYQQDFKEFLEKKFVFINDHGISCFDEQKVEEKSYTPDINEILASSHTLTNLWT